MSSRDIRTLYQDRYAGEKLVKITGEPPLVKAISGKHGVVSFIFVSIFPFFLKKKEPIDFNCDFWVF